MIQFLFSFFKRIVFATMLIYSVNLLMISVNVFVPINFFTVSLVAIFDIPCLFCLMIFSRII